MQSNKRGSEAILKTLANFRGKHLSRSLNFNRPANFRTTVGRCIRLILFYLMMSLEK